MNESLAITLTVISAFGTLAAGLAAGVSAWVALELLRVNRQLRDVIHDAEHRSRDLMVWSQIQSLNEAALNDPELFDEFIGADWNPDEPLKERRRRWAAFMWLAPTAAQLQANPDSSKVDGDVQQMLRDALHNPLVIRLIRTRGYPPEVRSVAESIIKDLHDSGELDDEAAMTGSDDPRVRRDEILVRPTPKAEAES